MRMLQLNFFDGVGSIERIAPKCVKRAEQFDARRQYDRYIDLYEEMLNE